MDERSENPRSGFGGESRSPGKPDPKRMHSIRLGEPPYFFETDFYRRFNSLKFLGLDRKEFYSFALEFFLYGPDDFLYPVDFFVLDV